MKIYSRTISDRHNRKQSVERRECCRIHAVSTIRILNVKTSKFPKIKRQKRFALDPLGSSQCPQIPRSLFSCMNVRYSYDAQEFKLKSEQGVKDQWRPQYVRIWTWRTPTILKKPSIYSKKIYIVEYWITWGKEGTFLDNLSPSYQTWLSLNLVLEKESTTLLFKLQSSHEHSHAFSKNKNKTKKRKTINHHSFTGIKRDK